MLRLIQTTSLKIVIVLLFVLLMYALYATFKNLKTDKEINSKGLLSAIFSIVVLMFLLFTCFNLLYHPIENHNIGFWQRMWDGEFGDSYGILNSLFTGLAMVFAGWAIWYQARELKAQQTEMKMTRLEFEMNRATNVLFRQMESFMKESNSITMETFSSLSEPPITNKTSIINYHNKLLDPLNKISEHMREIILARTVDSGNGDLVKIKEDDLRKLADDVEQMIISYIYPIESLTRKLNNAILMFEQFERFFKKNEVNQAIQNENNAVLRNIIILNSDFAFQHNHVVFQGMYANLNMAFAYFTLMYNGGFGELESYTRGSTFLEQTKNIFDFIHGPYED